MRLRYSRAVCWTRQASLRSDEKEGITEGLTGIEPALSAWEAEVLPLNYSPVPLPGEQANASLPAWPPTDKADRPGPGANWL